MENRDLPEWLRVISIFVLTFALVCVLGGLFVKLDRIPAQSAYGPQEEAM